MTPPRDPWAGVSPARCRATIAELAGWNEDARRLSRKEKATEKATAKKPKKVRA